VRSWKARKKKERKKTRRRGDSRDPATITKIRTKTHGKKVNYPPAKGTENQIKNGKDNVKNPSQKGKRPLTGIMGTTHC